MAKKKIKPLTDKEIGRKFNIAIDDPHFHLARQLSRYRTDTTLCSFSSGDPYVDIQCPHCGQESNVEVVYSEIPGGKWVCPDCERPMYVTSISLEYHVELSTNQKGCD